MSLTYNLFVVLGFLAVVLLLEGLIVLWNDTRSPEVKRVQRRLRNISAGVPSESEVPLLKQRLLSTVPAAQRILLQLPHIHRLDRVLLQAGSSQTVAQLLTVTMLCFLGGLLFPLIVLHWNWVGSLLFALAVGLVPVLRLEWGRARRLRQIGAQLPDALDMIARALRTGHAFSAALAMVGKEAPEPIAGEFKTTFDEINFGIPAKTALINLAERAPVPDLRYFVVAVLIQLETGGNLAELLTMLANLMRERFKLFDKIKVLAAEGKLSAYILIALPFFLAAALHVLNPGYLDILFTDPVGIRLVIATLVLMVMGAVLMWRIIDIRV